MQELYSSIDAYPYQPCRTARRLTDELDDLSHIPLAFQLLCHGVKQVIESGSNLEPGQEVLQRGPTDAGERERILARLAALHRIKEEVAGRNRPAMFHSVLQLINLETHSLRELERATLPHDGSSGVGRSGQGLRALAQG